MSKSKSGGSKAPKFNSAEEANTKIEELKGLLETAREERKVYAKDKGLSLKNENFEKNAADPKHGKTWVKMTKVIDDLKKGKEDAEAWIKENKPKKEGVARTTIYTYPADCTTDADKKKFRAASRAAAKKDDKAEKKAAKTEAKEKKGDKKKEDTPPADAPKVEKKNKDKTKKSTEPKED